MDSFAEQVLTPTISIDTKKVSNKTAFKPWHKPRKQWCRYNQWIKGVNGIVPVLIQAKESEFRYLGLPGDDLLDLRLLAHNCSKRGLKLKYLGFNSIKTKSVQNDDLTLSESELHKTGNISSESKVITEPLESLSRTDSSAFANSKSFNGFHMINFDLCNSIAANGPDYNGDTYFKALANIIEMQIGRMKTDWLFFLTTHVSKESVVKGTMQQLLKAVYDNISTHVDFENRFIEILNLNKDQIKAAVETPENLTDVEYMDLFALGFSKWILKLCTKALEFWKVELLESCNYRSGHEDELSKPTPNMLSIGIKFSYCPPKVNDSYNLAASNPTDAHNEAVLALAILDELNRIFNLDNYLSKNSKVLKELIDHSADLLASARYDRDAYLKWVEAGCISIRE